MLHASYIKVALELESFPKLINLLARSIRKHAKKADAVAFRGASGTLVGMSVCQELNLPPILVRKNDAHSSRQAEGWIDAKRIVIVDDMIQTGDTIRSIIDGIKEERSTRMIRGSLSCLGAFFYKELIDGNSHDFVDGLEHNGKIIPIIGVRKSLDKV